MVAGRVELQQNVELSPPQARSEKPLQQDAPLMLALQVDGTLPINGDVIGAAESSSVSAEELSVIDTEAPTINKQQLADKIIALNLAKDSTVIGKEAIEISARQICSM